MKGVELGVFPTTAPGFKDAVVWKMRLREALANMMRLSKVIDKPAELSEWSFRHQAASGNTVGYIFESLDRKPYIAVLTETHLVIALVIGDWDDELRARAAELYTVLDTLLGDVLGVVNTPQRGSDETGGDGEKEQR